MSENDRFTLIASVIRERATCKVLGDLAAPPTWPEELLPGYRQRLDECLAVAGWAPFHFARNVDGIAEPWRVHLFELAACRTLAMDLPTLVEVPPKNRLRNLLAGCGALALVTWLPVNDLDDKSRERQVNAEHLCAAGAYVQNLLLLLTAAGMESYWASPGLLAAPAVRNHTTIPCEEEPMAAVFCGFPGSRDGVVERLAGGNRNLRTPAGRCTRRIESLPGKS
jgi:Nitroreductase family